MNEKEIWKEIPGYEGLYEVSNLGRVKSLHLGKEKILKPRIVRGYHCFNFSKNGTKKGLYAHKLVAMVFLGHKPNGYKLVIDHINSDKQDNRLENLRIVTQRENTSKERTLKKGLPCGVYLQKITKLYRAAISLQGKRINLGYFKDPLEASEKYQQALKKYEEEKR
jgi:hypothetical protein